MFFYIIVVSYNAGKKLRMTLESIRHQTFRDYRVLIKDGMSDDGSVEDLKERFAFGGDGCSQDKTMRLIVSRDHGIYDAMNEALCAVCEEERKGAHDRAYVYFLNCGDVLASENVLKRVAKRTQQLPDDKRAILYGDVVEERTMQRVASNPKINDFACYRNVPCHQACFYDIRLMEDTRFETRYAVRADYAHFLELFYTKGALPRYIRTVIARYEGGGFSETKENRARSEKERKEIIARYLPRGKRLLFDAYRIVSLQPLREKLASSPKTAGVYQALKRAIYRG